MNLSGGILIVVLAALWFMVLVPSWSNKKTDRSRSAGSERKFQVTVERRQKIDANTHFGVSNLAIRNKNILRGRALFSGLFITSTVVIIANLITFAPTPTSYFTIGTAALVMVVSLFAIRAVNRSKAKLSNDFARSRSSISAQMAQYIRDSAVQGEDATEIVDERAWTPNQLPASLSSMRVGAIEATELADVLEFDERKIVASQKKLEAEALDEILKRRRAIS